MEGLPVLPVRQHAGGPAPRHRQVSLSSCQPAGRVIGLVSGKDLFFFKTGLELRYLGFSELLAVARKLADF